MYETEAAAVERDLQSFTQEFSVFQAQMAAEAPFGSKHSAEEAYGLLQQYSDRLVGMEAKALSLQRLERLFELEV